MGKFSDPNYKLLSDYFDILVAVRAGNQKSFLIGPNKTVVSEGGLWSILYVCPSVYKNLSSFCSLPTVS